MELIPAQKDAKPYDPLRDYLSAMLEHEVNEDEYETIMDLALKKDGHTCNVGYDVKRIESSPREKAFHDQWLDDNIPRPGYNYGQGILQDLFIERSTDGVRRMGKWNEVINDRDRRIVAHVIQWLGTNVGMAFLNAALARCGHTIYRP